MTSDNLTLVYIVFNNFVLVCYASIIKLVNYYMSNKILNKNQLLVQSR